MHNKMEHLPNNISEIPTLQVLVKSLGPRTDIVAAAQRILVERGHEYARSTIYSTIQRNGKNNPTIETAVLDAVEAEKKQRTELDARRQALSA